MYSIFYVQVQSGFLATLFVLIVFMFWLNLIKSIWHLEFYHLEFHWSLAMQILLLFPLKISSCAKWMSQRAWLLSLHELRCVFNAVDIPGSWNQGLQCNPNPLNTTRLCIFITTPGCGWCNLLRRKNGDIEWADRALYRQEREMCVWGVGRVRETSNLRILH